MLKRVDMLVVAEVAKFFQVKMTHEEKGINIIWVPNWGTQEGPRFHDYMIRALGKCNIETYVGPAPANRMERTLQDSVRELEAELKKFKI